MSAVRKLGRTIVTAVVDRSEARTRSRAAQLAGRKFETCLALIEQRWPESFTAPEEGAGHPPVFLLSAGWRSGSTLVQRLACSSGELLMWGEPYARSGYVPRMLNSLKAFCDQWPTSDMLVDSFPRERLHEEWIANLYPGLNDLRQAHRAFFDRLFAHPAVERGFGRWGIKEVRFGREEISYLRWLYPNAKFVLLVRDPRNSWRSYRGRIWFWRWPQTTIHSATQFARCWLELANDFIAASRTSGITLVRYEDLLAESGVIQSLEDHLGIKVDRKVLDRKVGGAGSQQRPAPKPHMADSLDRWLIERTCAATLRRLGYL